MLVQPYIFFDGKCDEALAFYRQALGAEVLMLMRYKDSPEPPKSTAGCPGATPESVMHTSFRIGDNVLMGSDGRCEGKPSFQGISLSITTDTAAEAEKVFAALSAGGTVQMPMTKTFFSERFGMAADKFGLSWMVMAKQ